MEERRVREEGVRCADEGADETETTAGPWGWRPGWWWRQQKTGWATGDGCLPRHGWMRRAACWVLDGWRAPGSRQALIGAGRPGADRPSRQVGPALPPCQGDAQPITEQAHHTSHVRAGRMSTCWRATLALPNESSYYACHLLLPTLLAYRRAAEALLALVRDTVVLRERTSVNVCLMCTWGSVRVSGSGLLGLWPVACQRKVWAPRGGEEHRCVGIQARQSRDVLRIGKAGSSSSSSSSSGGGTEQQRLVVHHASPIAVRDEHTPRSKQLPAAVQRSSWCIGPPKAAAQVARPGPEGGYPRCARWFIGPCAL